MSPNLITLIRVVLAFVSIALFRAGSFASVAALILLVVTLALDAVAPRQGIVSVMIEGGGAVAASALKEKVVDKILFFYAPKILGGDGRPMIEALGFHRVKQAIAVKDLGFTRSGKDLVVSGYV